MERDRGPAFSLICHQRLGVAMDIVRQAKMVWLHHGYKEVAAPDLTTKYPHIAFCRLVFTKCLSASSISHIYIVIRIVTFFCLAAQFKVNWIFSRLTK